LSSLEASGKHTSKQGYDEYKQAIGAIAHGFIWTNNIHEHWGGTSMDL